MWRVEWGERVLMRMLMYMCVCHNGNLRWDSKEYRDMFFCHAAKRQLEPCWWGEELSDSGFLGVFLGLVCINILESHIWRASQPAASQPVAHFARHSTTLISPHISSTFSPTSTATLFDSISTCYLPSFTRKREILQAPCAGSPLRMLFEVCVFSV